MISELIDKLRAESKSMGKYGVDYMATLLMQVADTIEMLLERARIADTQQTDKTCDYCQEFDCYGCKHKAERSE